MTEPEQNRNRLARLEKFLGETKTPPTPEGFSARMLAAAQAAAEQRKKQPLRWVLRYAGSVAASILLTIGFMAGSLLVNSQTEETTSSQSQAAPQGLDALNMAPSGSIGTTYLEMTALTSKE